MIAIMTKYWHQMKKILFWEKKAIASCSAGLQRKIICKKCGRKPTTIIFEAFKGKANKSSKSILIADNSVMGIRNLEKPKFKFDLRKIQLLWFALIYLHYK